MAKRLFFELRWPVLRKQPFSVRAILLYFAGLAALVALGGSRRVLLYLLAYQHSRFRSPGNARPHSTIPPQSGLIGEIINPYFSSTLFRYVLILNPRLMFSITYISYLFFSSISFYHVGMRTLDV